MLRDRWPRASIQWNDDAMEGVASQVFQYGNRFPGKNPLQAHVRGTRFQVRVWRALLDVPQGALVSYGQLARAAGRPGAARAVGVALGSNPLAYLIPCHRVIRETGVLGGYRWGPVRKRAMVAWESAPRSAAEPLHEGEIP